ncbi:hypothetical protein NDI56_06960 [Haloarcula sp. S1CR25-12]|uniref:DUF3311 domain-containing protein n=1 Tax=Haloarcula saliterrae TaxID=2950534 RepID=A0ABU2FBP0_9EURY|nr:hypothetical protein [Haloarcula sp. S1CR25-12]MDS0259130.1 hypothetical protein [Haloarcula sp. S1CR25-12]
MNRNDTIALGLTIAAVVIVPGLANAYLSQWGYPWVGSAVWATGYGLGVLYIWYEWIRPIDITGPEGVGYEQDESTEE